jgi:predicted PhzF superfamily epimerase YddE/YHI9
MAADLAMLHSFVSINGVAPRLQRCAGNHCLLYSYDAPPLDAPAAGLGMAQCQSWPESCADEVVIATRCYSEDVQLIQCCGHGLLAAAHSWQRRLQRDALSLSMNGSLVASSREGDVTWLRFAHLQILEQDVPEWLEQVFIGTRQAQAAAVAGGARDYLVLQWPDGFDLGRLPCPTVALADWTERALICTSARPDWGEGVIQLRYFAPQYGVDEDAATGSAMRVLAQFWSSRFSQLVAYQSSPAGGMLLSRCTATHVEVGGRCVSGSADAL